MKLIPGFDEFEKSIPLEGKIPAQLAEKAKEYFSREENVNEAGVLDSIKNTLSKTFLGSLSYINMIDKLRSEILKLEKESISKKYQHEKEMESLNNSLKNLVKTNNETAVVQAKKNISNKLNEYEVYGKMMDAKIKKILDLVREIIKGNKRRSEYWETGKAQDEADLLEFEYNLAKRKYSYSSAELKKLEEEWRKAEEEAKKAEQERKEKEEEEKKKEQQSTGPKSSGVGVLDKPTSNYDKDLKSPKKRAETINKIKKEIADLETKLDKQKTGSVEKIKTQSEIDGLDKILKVFNEVDKKLKTKRILTKEEVSKIYKEAISQLGPNIINKGSSRLVKKSSPSLTKTSKK